MSTLITAAFAALLATLSGVQDTLPPGDSAAAVNAAQPCPMMGRTNQMGRGAMMQLLQEEGGAEALALLERADLARVQAYEAFQAGDTAAARIHRQEARAYMHTAVLITFPEYAARMGERCQQQQTGAAAGACRMEQGAQAGMGRGMRSGNGQGRMIERLDQLRAEADEETGALLDLAAEARLAARAAYQAGDTIEARARMQEARDAMQQAVARLDPDLAGCWQQGGNGMGTGRRGMGRR